MKLWSQTFKVARYCVRKKVEEKDVDEEELDPLHRRMRAAGSVPWQQHARRDIGNGLDVDEAKGNWASRTGTPRSADSFYLEEIPAMDCPALSEQLPSPHRSHRGHPEWKCSLDKKYEPSSAPEVDRAQYDLSTWDQLNEQRPPRGFRRKESKEDMKTRLALMYAAEANRKPKGSVKQDTPIYVDGRRERAPGKEVKDSDVPAKSPGTTQLDGKRGRAPLRGAKDSDIPALLSGRTFMGGNRERAPVKGVKGSDIPAQLGGETPLAGER